MQSEDSKPEGASKSIDLGPQSPIIYEGESLSRLIRSIEREIEAARKLDRALPFKLWVKQQFSIGVNDVTRVLERMPPVIQMRSSHPQHHDHAGLAKYNPHKSSPQLLQVILLASECKPQWLTKHLPSLAASRNVPLIVVKDNKGGSLRLGELMKIKTAIAIGVKARGNDINQLMKGILGGSKVDSTIL